MYLIREIIPTDIPACASLLVDAYNREPWNDCWTMESAERYLREFLAADRFMGLLLEKDGNLSGVAFCHSRTWYTGDELYVDELYIASNAQRQGLGGELLARMEQFVRAEGLKGITLLTNRFFPAREFYKNHGFEEAEHVLFMYKTLK